MKVVILAAGRGKRMLQLTKQTPKCMLRLNDETLLSRLIKQLNAFNIKNITVVVGYKKRQIIKVVRKFGENIVTFIENENYRKDMNILSLSLALKRDLTPFYLFEADCIFENKCFELIFNPAFKDKSVWFSNGLFTKGQSGGIIKSNNFNEVVDIKIVDKYREKYRGYKKMIGVLKVGKNELEEFSYYLFKTCEKSINQYYHIPWIEHINELKSYLYDFNGLKVASVNNIEDYHKAQEMFKGEVS